MKIYCFYKRLDNLYEKYSILDHERVLEIWEKSWRYYGWEPVILTEKDICIDSNYSSLLKNIKTIPTKNDFEYEKVCYLRWLAMLGKSGWFCDYDMINYGFTPCEYQDKIATSSKYYTIGASTVYGPKSFYQKIVSTLINFNLEKFKKSVNSEDVQSFDHLSDMIILSCLIKPHLALNVLSVTGRKSLIKHYYYDKYKKFKYESILSDPRSKVFL